MLVKALQQQLQEERSRSTKAQELTTALKMELQSTQQQMETMSAAHDQQQQTLEQLRTALQTSQSQLAQSQSERDAANRLHEAKLRELHERLKIAETAAATAAAKQPITQSNVPVLHEQPITESNVPASAPAPSQEKAAIEYYTGPFVADQEVQARWKTQKDWIDSRILTVNPDGTYRVVYEGQHVAGSVPQSSIRSTHPPPGIPSVDEIPEPPAEDSDDPTVLFPGHKIVDVVARRHPTRGFGLKFKLINSGDVNQALYISEVSDPSSGLKASDKLYSVDGQRATSFRGLKPLIADKKEIKLRVLRASLVVQGVDLDSLSTIELKKMLRERNFDTKCNRATAIKKLTMSLDNEADEDQPKPVATRPTTKFQIFAVQVGCGAASVVDIIVCVRGCVCVCVCVWR